MQKFKKAKKKQQLIVVLLKNTGSMLRLIYLYIYIYIVIIDKCNFVFQWINLSKWASTINIIQTLSIDIKIFLLQSYKLCQLITIYIVLV